MQLMPLTYAFKNGSNGKFRAAYFVTKKKQEAMSMKLAGVAQSSAG